MAGTTVNPNLGEIRKAKELGYKGHCQYIWHACALCGNPRWTELRRGGPRYAICATCANQQAELHQNGEQDSQAHACPPHHWLIDSSGMGRCKYCSEMKDFRELLRKSKGKNLNYERKTGA